MSNSNVITNKKRQNVELGFGKAICYSGYREGQSPREQIYPSPEQVVEDLLILAQNWQFLRLYDCSQHADLVLEAVSQYSLNFKLMLGVDMRPEMSNPGCPWGAEFSDEQLYLNRQANSAEIDRMIELANQYPDIVFAASVGNEASVEWTDHMVSVDSLVDYARRVKQAIKQPVTFCENYLPWVGKLEPLAEVLDFLSVHTYPVWEYKSLGEALVYSKENYFKVADHYPHKPIIITEAGWTTSSNGRGIESSNASQQLQARYYEELMNWIDDEKILTFVFEAFDEPWKGSSDPLEPEKHWGLFTLDRKPKLVMKETYAQLI